MTCHLLDVLNSIPVVGHIKGAVQRTYGEDEAAAQAFLEANRTTAVLAAGAAGFYMAGIPLAIMFGTVTGAQCDLWAIIPTNGKHMQGICKIVDDPTNFKAWFDATVELTNDGVVGLYGGRIIRAVKTALGLIDPAFSVQGTNAEVAPSRSQ